MTFPILGGNGAVAGYSIDNSLRFNDGDNPRLTRTMATGTSRRIFTFSTWLKRSHLGSFQYVFTNSPQSSFDAVRINSDDTLDIRFNDNAFTVRTNRVYRDVSSWYHILVAVDTTQSTASDRVKIYTNGSLETSLAGTTYPTQNYDTSFGVSGQEYQVSANTWNDDQAFDGYMAEVHFIDGTAKAPTDFGEYDEDSGIWKPKRYSGSYGTNGYKLNFSNSGSLGADSSGNGNNFTPTNLASTDQTTDTPTNNFATLNPLDLNTLHSYTISEGNTKSANPNFIRSNFAKSSGKWYCEVKCVSTGCWNGIRDISQNIANEWSTNSVSLFIGGATLYISGASQGLGGYGSSWSANEIMMMAVDLDSSTKKIYFGKNGGWWNGSDYSAGSPSTGVTLANDVTYQFQFGSGSGTSTNEVNFGNPPFSITSGNSDGNGYGNFEYAPPSGYLALCTQNLATELSPTIDDGSQYFNTVLWTGNGGTNAITGVGFKPDWVWGKDRTGADNHHLFDTTRGTNQRLISNLTTAENTESNCLDSFDSDGFTLGSNTGLNNNGDAHVAWNWKANGGTTSSNTSGSITSTVQANTTAGFSIVTYTGNGGGQTIGHGLSQAPVLSIRKKRNTTGDWFVHTNIFDGGMDYLKLNTTDAKSSSSLANFTATTSGADDNSDQYVVYFFHSVEGYSKIGTYTGNGSTDGTFVHTGFKPAFIITKKTDGASNWGMLDATRSSFNLADDWLGANLSNAESVETTRSADLLSNGFKARGTNGDINHDSPYIYMAFAENPFVSSSGVPVTAR